ncbi:arylesterase [Thiomicrorhabdus sp. ZW0627]|uniref:arylesterase n=1 Tax=Thiomicrorhabdus sp. ZW0627 TaxID=3039774 RepID=UPI0024362D34|nr:arylesterase [Thiomicrorhabdus sp. ZW0627]MDG6774139.1 arylesterase [Thiomicrorhabdus sp. ZW0627]
MRVHFGWLFWVVGICLYPSLTVAQPQAVNQADSKPIVLVLGDSLSAAYGMESERGWVSLLQQEHKGLQVVNASISGETTSGGKQRLPALMKQYSPDVLVLELGANDALRGQDLNSTKRNLQTMIDACKTRSGNCEVVLLGIRLPTNYGPAYDLQLQKMYESLSKETDGIRFDPFFIEDVALDPDLMQWDGLHPNAEAQPEILKRVWPLIEQALQEAARKNRTAS